MTHSSWFPDPALIIGASRGIGLALAREVLTRSSDGTVILASRSALASDELSPLVAQYEGRLTRMTMDVTDQASVADTARRLDELSVRPALVLNAAGLLHDADQRLRPEKRLEDLDAEAMQRVFAVNSIGTALCLRYFLPLMADEGKAVFASISARVGSIGDNRLGGWYSYRASKAALNQLIKTGSIEARRRFENVILTALHPGTTDTALSAPFQANVPEGKLFTPQFVAQQLLQVIDGLSIKDSGGFFAWDGERIPW
ncbi:MAG: SDR family NAD(P)-dependent oxidoreductase [Wenzhouxiangella sp.]|jgi:NAD(P)-dependent dehydrogenase (short-subunit alcohol dehydrogenase family)|nr:SDR family NAD(P)-dependent oxidoreductase [Wenzhouxiangella sp.]